MAQPALESGLPGSEAGRVGATAQHVGVQPVKVGRRPGVALLVLPRGQEGFGHRLLAQATQQRVDPEAALGGLGGAVQVGGVHLIHLDAAVLRRFPDPLDTTCCRLNPARNRLTQAARPSASGALQERVKQPGDEGRLGDPGWARPGDRGRIGRGRVRRRRGGRCHRGELRRECSTSVENVGVRGRGRGRRCRSCRGASPTTSSRWSCCGGRVDGRTGGGARPPGCETGLRPAAPLGERDSTRGTVTLLNLLIGQQARGGSGRGHGEVRLRRPSGCPRLQRRMVRRRLVFQPAYGDHADGVGAVDLEFEDGMSTVGPRHGRTAPPGSYLPLPLRSTAGEGAGCARPARCPGRHCATVLVLEHLAMGGTGRGCLHIEGRVVAARDRLGVDKNGDAGGCFSGMTCVLEDEAVATVGQVAGAGTPRGCR